MCLAWLFFSGGMLHAVEFSSRLWQMEDGLPHNIVQALAQTQDGYLWVGTREGLARFDGARFKTIELSPELKHPSILRLLETPDRSLWVATEGAGLFRIQEGKVMHYSAPEGVTNYSVFDLVASGNSLWVASSRGILEFTGDQLVWRSPFRNLIQSLAVDASGGVWQAGEGLQRLNGAATNYTIQSGPVPRDARKLYADRDGAFWIASGNGLTELRDGKATYHHKADGPSGFVSVLFRDRSGEFWIGSYSGLSRLSDGEFINQSAPDEPSYQVYALMEDREGSVWAGSEEGLTRLTPKAFKTYTKRDGLTLNRVVTVAGARDGSIWVGLHGGGLNHLVNGKIETLNKANGLSSDFVMAMCEGHDGSLWLGTDYGSTLNRIKDGRTSYIGPDQGFVAAATTALLEGEDGLLWVGTREALYSLRDGILLPHTTKDGLSHNKINALCASWKGGFWVGTAGGLSRWHEGKFENLAAKSPDLRNAILSLHEDARGVLWIGTKGKGLMRWDKGAARTFADPEGLSSDSIYAILEDTHGKLWLNGSRGIFRLNKDELEAVAAGRSETVTSIAYGKSDGILCSGQYGEVTQPAGCKSTDGRLWFRTTQGVAVVDPDKIATNLLPPPVTIEEIVADRKTVAEAPLLGTLNSVFVPKGRGEMEIRYAGLSLRAPEKNRYRYRLKGADLDWVDAGARRSAYYSKVPPGDYRFEVTACNNDGVWNVTPAVIKVHVEPHFWQTRSFSLACILGSAGLIAGAVRYATRRKMNRELARLEQQNAVERERARIARDIHDDIGTGLTEIALTSELLEDPSVPGDEARQLAGEISGRARQLVTGMDEIVWAINPRNDTVKSAAVYFSQFAQRLLKPAAISCRLDIAPDLPESPLSSEQRHNLFLGFKEALNNVTKHARASEVKLAVKMDGDDFTVSVQDNGSGFAPGLPASAEDGLINMRERMERLGGECEITSEAGRGTRVLFRLPLNATHVPA